MYNIPCIHRAFSLTYSCPELFIPIRDIKFIVDSELKKGWVQFQVDERYAHGNSLRYVPKQYEKVKYQDSTKYLMRKKQRFAWDIHGDKKQRLESLSKYHGRTADREVISREAGRKYQICFKVRLIYAYFGNTKQNNPIPG